MLIKLKTYPALKLQYWVDKNLKYLHEIFNSENIILSCDNIVSIKG